MLISRRTDPDARGGTDRDIGHAAVVGAVIGYFAVLTIVASIVLAAGAGLGVAVGIGAFVALWGGPGWGGMMAAQLCADRIAAEERKIR